MAAEPHDEGADVIVCLLGGFSIAVNGVGVTLPPACQELIAFVALTGPVARPRATATLFPELGDRAGQHAMRSLLWRLRRLARPALVDRGATLEVPQYVRVDARCLDDDGRRLLVSEADRLAVVGGRRNSAEHAPTGVVDPLAAVLSWVGAHELLPGCEQSWLILERERIRYIYVHALEAAARSLLQAGLLGLALDTAIRVTEVDPLREEPVRLVIDVLMAEGDYSGALRAYERYCALLRSEIGLSPSSQLQFRLDPIRSDNCRGARNGPL